MSQAGLSPGFSLWVDAFRWTAAFSVLLTHIGIRMLPPFGGMAAETVPHLAYLFLAGFDHQAVMAFFVLSGFLVGGSVITEIRLTGGLDAIAYLQRRLVRLCVVLWPALLLAAICAAATAADTPAASAAVLLCNMVFLQTAACPQFAGNGALWSLFNEAWYYALFPPLALAMLTRQRALRRCVWAAGSLAALSALTCVQFTGAKLGPYMLVWLAGTGVAWLDRPLLRRPWHAALLLAAILLGIRVLVRRDFAALHPAGAFSLDLAMAASFAILLLSLKHAPDLRPPPWPALHRSLAGFSFSLYCIHIPLLTALLALLAELGWAANGWPAVLAAWILCLAAAWAFARLTEAHTGAVRQWLRGPWLQPLI